MVHIVVHVHVRYALFHCRLHSQCGNTCTTYLDVVGTLHEINKDPSILKIHSLEKKLTTSSYSTLNFNIPKVKYRKIPKEKKRSGERFTLSLVMMDYKTLC